MDQRKIVEARLETELAWLQAELNAADRTTSSELGVGTAEDLALLRTLLREGPQRVGALARSRAASMATISARLDRLEQRGLIVRNRLPGDRRSVAAALTSEGIEAATLDRTNRRRALATLETLPDPDRIASLSQAIAESGAVAQASPEAAK